MTSYFDKTILFFKNTNPVKESVSPSKLFANSCSLNKLETSIMFPFLIENNMAMISSKWSDKSRIPCKYGKHNVYKKKKKTLPYALSTFLITVMMLDTDSDGAVCDATSMANLASSCLSFMSKIRLVSSASLSLAIGLTSKSLIRLSTFVVISSRSIDLLWVESLKEPSLSFVEFSCCGVASRPW